MESDQGGRGEKGEREGKCIPLIGHIQADCKEKNLCVKVSHNWLRIQSDSKEKRGGR